MTDIFLSYSRKDKAFAQRLFEALNEEELDAWVDWEGIPPTSDWLAEIYAGIEEADTFVFVISPDSLASEVCGWELDHAVKHNKRLIPIVAREPGKTEIVQTLASHQWVLMRENDDFEKGVGTVLKAITLDLSWLKAHTRILTRALEWVKFEKNTSYLLRGSDLGDGEAWLARAGESVSPKPTDLQTEYILASRKQATKIQRQTLFGVAAALVLSIGLAIVAIGQWNASQKNESIALTQEGIAVANESIAVTQEAIAAQKEAEALEAQGVAEEALAVQEEQAVLIAAQARTAKAQALGATSLNLAESDSQLALLLALYGAQETANDEVMLPEVRQALYAGVDSNLLKIYTGNLNAVLAVALSPDGKTAYAGGLDGYIRGWDIATGALVVEFETGRWDRLYEVTSLASSPDGRLLASASNLNSPESHISIWDLETLERTWHYTYRNANRVNPTVVKFSADSTLLALGFSDGVTEIYEVANDRIRTTTGGADDVFSVAFSPDSSLMAVGYFDGTITIWDAETGAFVIKINAHERGAVKTIEAGGPSGDTEYPQGVTGLAFSPDGTQLVSTGINPGVALWDVDSGARLGVFEGHVGQVNDIAFSPDGTFLATVGNDSRVILWDRNSFSVAREYGGHFSEALALSFNQEGTQLLTGGKDGTVKLWSVINESRLLYQLQDPNETSQNYSHMDVNWDGSELLSTKGVYDLLNDSHPLTIFDLTTGEIKEIGIEGYQRFFYQDSGALIYSNLALSQIMLLDIETKTQEVLVEDTGANGARTHQLSPDETFLFYTYRTFAAGDPYFGVIVDLATGETRGQSPLYWRDSVLGPGGKYIVVVDNATVFDVDSEEIIIVLNENRKYLRHFAWSVDGAYLAGITANNTILVWDAETFELLYTLAGHIGEIHDLAFLKNEATLISGGEDGVIRFWDMERGELYREIDDPTTTIVDIEISGDDGILAAAQADGKIFVYRLNSDNLIEQALARLTRGDLTDKECQLYLGLDNCSLGWLEE